MGTASPCRPSKRRDRPCLQPAPRARPLFNWLRHTTSKWASQTPAFVFQTPLKSYRVRGNNCRRQARGEASRRFTRLRRSTRETRRTMPLASRNTGSPTVRNSSFTNTSLPVSLDCRLTEVTATDPFGCALNGFKEPRRHNPRNAAARGSRCRMIPQNRQPLKTCFIAG